MEIKQLREVYEAFIYGFMQDNTYEFKRTNAGWMEDFKTFFAQALDINLSNSAHWMIPLYNALLKPETPFVSSFSFKRFNAEELLNLVEKEGILTWDHKPVINPSVKINFEAACKAFEGTKYLLSTYKGTDGKIRSVRIKDIRQGAALFNFIHNPDQHVGQLNPSALFTEILPMDVESRRKTLSPETKKKFSMRSTVSEHFEICMSFITGKDMRWCLGISHITNPMTWTPTKTEETKERFVNKIDEILRLNQASAACYEQMNLLKKLYEEHGEGHAFLNWVAAEVEAKLFEDPGKYIDHKVFGAAAKAMLACG